MTTIDYDAWAKTYDDTRGASPSVLRPLLEALGPPDGRSLLDIGGGTGNYSLALRGGWLPGKPLRPLRRDGPASRVEARTSRRRGWPASSLSRAAFDCAVAIKVMNHVPDWQTFFAEARRILREGPLVLVHATRETMRANWITHYIPRSATKSGSGRKRKRPNNCAPPDSLMSRSATVLRRHRGRLGPGVKELSRGLPGRLADHEHAIPSVA